MIKKYFFLLFILAFTILSHGQNKSISENTEISVLTIGPGNSLNDAFGHNAFRVKNTTTGVDRIYDYGRYDFETPNFYLKFAQGKLLYEVGSNNFQPFVDYYKSQNRWVKEQVLALTSEEKKQLTDFLITNALPENKQYKYDFFYDNCATRIRDVLQNSLHKKLHFSEEHISETNTFRQLIQKNVHWNTWGSMGMDVAIGAVVDIPTKPYEYQFLPEYVFQGVANATVKNNNQMVPLAKETIIINAVPEKKLKSAFFSSPLFIFGLLGMLIIGFTVYDIKKAKRTRTIDGLIFTVTGLIGVFIFLLWFATDHSATANNYNLLWAFMFNIFIVYPITRKEPRAWVRKYVFFLILLLVLLYIHWLTGVQSFAPSLTPIFIALATRYIFLVRNMPIRK